VAKTSRNGLPASCNVLSSEILRNGASDREIMRQTGHKSRTMIDRYARAEQQDRQAAVRKLGV
jgi:integrase